LAAAVADVLIENGWPTVYYVYDSSEGYKIADTLWHLHTYLLISFFSISAVYTYEKAVLLQENRAMPQLFRFKVREHSPQL